MLPLLRSHWGVAAQAILCALLFAGTIAVVRLPASEYAAFDNIQTGGALGLLADNPSQDELSPSPAESAIEPQNVSAVPAATSSLASEPVKSPRRISLPAEDLNASTRAALVNILCTTKTGGGNLRPISGSGVIVDTRGVVLTNAHVGQFFLLRDYPFPRNVECVIRTGSPARAAYTAELLYLPSAWIKENASQISSSEPKGTGENDYAFLVITGTTNPFAPLPSSFHALPLDSADPIPGDQMLLASYPAGFLHGLSIETGLYLSSAFATVQEVFVFHEDHLWVDLFSVPGTVVSQAGSSGGAAVRAHNGTLAGILVTSTTASTTAGRDLRAVSVSHIDQTLIEAGEGGITGLLSNDIGLKALAFNKNTAPLLEAALIESLNK